MDKVTFIRIPKNASTSLYSFFGENNTIRDELLEVDNDTYLNIFAPSHCSLEQAVEQIGSGLLDHPILAVIRNPFDRLVSMFFFAKKYDLGALYGINTEDFDTFASDFYHMSKDDTFFHAMSQSQYIEHESPVTIIRFESLDEDMKQVGYDNLPKLNSTEHSNYKEYYSAKSKGIVKAMWECDLDNFDYSFNN